MFKLKAIVPDKHIGEVLERLKGITGDIKVEFIPGKPLHKPRSKSNGEHYARSMDTIELLTMELHKRKLLEVKGMEFKDIVTGMGLPPSSYTYYLHGLVKAGVLKEHATVGTAKIYRVTGK